MLQPPGWIRATTPGSALCGLLFSAAILAATPHAVLGQTTDRPMVDRGELRLTIAPAFLLSDERLLPDGLAPLSGPWSGQLGTGFAPTLLPTEAAIRGAIDDPGWTLSLGRGAAQLSTVEARVPIALSVGVLDRLTLSATVPLVRGRTEASTDIVGTDGGNVGFNPRNADPQGVTSLLDALSGAADAAQLAADGVCTDQGAASQACTSALATASATAVLAGDASELYTTLELFPVTGSDAAAALDARLDALAAGLAELGVVGAPGAFLYAEPLGAGELEPIVREPQFGAGYVDFGNWRGGWGLGDVDFQASVLLLRRTTPEGDVRAELSGGALGRLGTGEVDDRDRLFQFGRGEGFDAVGGFAHLVLATGRFGIEVDGRYLSAFEADIPVRIGSIGSVVRPLDSRTTATVDPGSRMQIDVSPRLRLAPELALALRYTMVRDDADRFTRAAADGPDPSVLDHAADLDVRRIGGGLVFAPDYREAGGGRSFEVRAQASVVMDGEGAGQRAPLQAGVEVRVFRRLFGG